MKRSLQPNLVVLRADASMRIGTGHVRRCASLGAALKEFGADVLLVARRSDVDLRRSLGSVEVELVELPKIEDGIGQHDNGTPHGEWSPAGWAMDASQVVMAIGGRRASLVVVDHYAFDARWHDQVRGEVGASIAAIDDLADRDLSAEWIIDHNVSRSHAAKWAGRCSNRSRLLCGPRFALLAPEYARATRYAFQPEVRSIGIFMGGADAAGASADMLFACRQVAKFQGLVEIAVTRANPHLPKLEDAVQETPNTRLLVDEDNLATFFGRHDLQIGAGGGATWERCCLGAPALLVVCAENQRQVVGELARLDAVDTVDYSGSASVEEVGCSILNLIKDPQRRHQLSVASGRLVDGVGARRVAAALLGSRQWLREATMSDARLIHDWRQHPAIRATSRDSSEFTWQAHIEWLGKVLADPTRNLWISMIGTCPIGVIRFDEVERGRSSVSLYLDPELSGLGLGSVLLASGEDRLRSLAFGPLEVQADILTSNMSSQRLFERAGYCPSDGYWTKRIA